MTTADTPATAVTTFRAPAVRSARLGIGLAVAAAAAVWAPACTEGEQGTPLACPAERTLCGAACVDTGRHPGHCGGCEQPCALDQVCAAGTCAAQCPPPTIACAGTCIDPARDDDHCGASADCQGPSAGVPCPRGSRCDAGQCVTACPTGQLACGGRCIDPLSDREHCGASGDCAGPAAGAACPAETLCDDGACRFNCGPGRIVCDGTCTDPRRDRDHCGASGDCTGVDAGEACAAGTRCEDGACQVICADPRLACASGCVDPQTDRRHCGATGDCSGMSAGQVCGAGTVCSAGMCGPGCPAGLVFCGGGCIDPRVEPEYCGASGDCVGQNAGVVCGTSEVCVTGQCALECPVGLVDCAGTCVDPLRDRDHCGAGGTCTGMEMGTVCTAGDQCVAGGCVAGCAIGHLVCGGGCVDPTVADAYCGATSDCTGMNAGVSCPPGTTCTAGSCEISCTAGRIDCGGACIDPNTDRQHCGATGDCTGSNAGTACAGGWMCNGAGECAIDCAPGFLDCNGQCVDPTVDRNFCGARTDCQGANAGVACAATEACAASACVALAGVTSVGVAVTSSDVTLSWLPSVTPGYGRTRIIKQVGAPPADPQDGIVVVDTGDGMGIAIDDTVAVWERWYYALFAMNTGATDFSVGVVADATGTFIHGTKRCPSDEVLRGVAPGLDLQCEPVGVSTGLECVTTLGFSLGGLPATALCSAGYTATGGGFAGIDQNGAGTVDDNFSSRREGNGWRVAFDDEVNAFSAWVRCCRTTISYAFSGPSPCAADAAVAGLDGSAGPDDGVTCGKLLPDDEPLDCYQSAALGWPGLPGTGSSSCLGQHVVTGGGFDDVDQDDTGSAADDFGSRMVGGAWLTTFEDEVDRFNSYAQCCLSTVTPTTHTTSGSCPAGEIAVGIDWDGVNPASLVCVAPTVSTSLSCLARTATGDATTPAMVGCQGNESLTGGGFADIDQNGAGGFDAFSSFHSSGTDWQVHFLDEVDTFEASAICCTTSATVSTP